MNRRVATVGLLACAGLAAAASRLDPTGVWEVVDYSATDPSSGAVQHPFGPHPIGTAIYTKKGHMSVFVSGSQRTPASGKAALFDSLYAYTGTYTVHGSTVSIHVESAWQPDWVGTDKTRTLDFDQGFLTITTPPMTSPVDGKTYISITRFRRVE
jgi:hypothetical protein